MRKKNSSQQQKTLGTINKRLQTLQTLQNLKEVLELLVQENKEQKIIIQYLEDKLDRTNSVRSN
jgi:hypothetical protein